MRWVFSCICMVFLFCGVAFTDEWRWTREENPKYVAYVEHHDWYWMSHVSNCKVEDKDPIGYAFGDNETKPLEFYGDYKNIKTEILAFRWEVLDGKVRWEFGENNLRMYFIKYKLPSGEIKNDWLDISMYVKTRKKINKKDVGGFPSNKSLSSRIRILN